MAADFNYLTVDERDDLEQAFQDAGITYDLPTRARLLDGVNRQYVTQFLRIVGLDPSIQLGMDLMQMSRIERLVDGTVPLAQWLRNAARRFSVLPQRTLFEKALNKVTRTGEATTPVIAVADTPATDFEEIDTDGIDDLQDISFLSIGAKRLPAVAKVLAPSYQGGKQLMMPDNQNPAYGAGTGWLIGSDLLMTNYHVIRNRSQGEPLPSNDDLQLQALGTRAHFFFDADDAEGKKIKVRELVAFDAQSTSDFALLRLDEKPNVDFLPVLDEKVEVPPAVQTPKGTVVRAFAVNIIQHPSGGPKRVALRNNLVYTAEYPKLHYFTDTLSGSSGSPVFNDGWSVIGLHRAAVAKTTVSNGKTLRYVNEGIQLHAILASLSELAKTDPKIAIALAQIREEQKAYH